METNQLLINYYKKEELKKAKTRHQKGMTIDEIIRLANKEYITEEEVKEILGIYDDEIEEQDLGENIKEEIDIVVEDEYEEKSNFNEQVVLIEESNLEDYPNQPFKLYNEDKKKEMIESIKINGIMQPLIVRPINNGKYQILAGHNRRICAKEIGLNKLPCIIKEKLTEDEARIYLIDTNLCTRDNISTMERARAYRIKYDTYKRKNIESSIMEEIEKDNMGLRGKFVKQERSSNGSIQRYLRLTQLIPKLQDLVDNNKLSINVGEKVSFLPNEEQKILAEILEKRKIKLSESIVKRIRKAVEECRKIDEKNILTKEQILDLIKMKKEEVEDIITITFSKEEKKKYFDDYKSIEEIKNYILKVLESR